MGHGEGRVRGLPPPTGLDEAFKYLYIPLPWISLFCGLGPHDPTSRLFRQPPAVRLAFSCAESNGVSSLTTGSPCPASGSGPGMFESIQCQYTASFTSQSVIRVFM